MSQAGLADEKQSKSKVIQSRVSEFVKKETCSPFKAHKIYLDQQEREKKRLQNANQYKLMLSPNAKEAMAMEKRRKALYPSQVVSANTL